jgi:outer membrane receptor protein involved in Fe transport
MSFVFSELMPTVNFLTFGTLRAGWGRTGKGADPYLTNSVFVQGNMSDGFRELTFPLPGSINGFEVSNRIGNPELTHELSEEVEVGTDLRFLKNRIRLDFTYYNRNITNQIYPVSIPYSSGYSTQVANIGKITNKGVELLINLVPVRTTDFKWDITINFAKNNNELVELTEGLDKIALGGLSTITMVAVPGEPLGLIEGEEPLRDTLGRIVVGSNGLPIPASEKKIYGSVYHDWVGGIGTSVTWKGLSLSGLLDIRQGGIMYSRTADIAYFAGTAPETIFNDRQPFIVPNSVTEVGVDTEGNPVYGENTVPVSYHEPDIYSGNTLHSYWGDGGDRLDESFLLSKSFIKLREISLLYTLPARLTESVNIARLSIGVAGRNLFIWTPNDQKFIDPEMSTFDDGLGLLAEYGEFSAAPTTRSIGFNLKLTF